MKEYPIYKHLIQFSNMVDSQGNFLEDGQGCEMKPKEETKKPDEKSDEQEAVNEGGEGEQQNYEGGDSETDG